MHTKRGKSIRPIALLIPMAFILVCAACPALYPLAALSYARSNGVFGTPQQGVISNANHWYCGVDKVEIQQAATNSFDGSEPHVWYVIYTVYARSHAPCDATHPGAPLYHQTYESGGNFYLDTRDGWVMMPEGLFPGYIGRWMKAVGLAGPGDPTHVPRY